jgi:hypothetical protein
MGVSLIAIIIFNDYKKAYSTNLTSFFLINFFVYVFLYNYSFNYFEIYFTHLFLNSLVLGFLIIIFSIGVSLILKHFRKSSLLKKDEKVSKLNGKSLFVCPNCGTEFNSIPLYCYNCNSKLIKEGDVSE